MPGRESVLLVDDEEEIRDLMTRLIESIGHRPLTATNGVEGLEISRKEEPDLILLDVKMPEKDGWEVLEELRLDPELSDIPVIMLTALDSSDNIVKGFNLGADDYITKPFEYQVVKARIGAVIRRSRSSGSEEASKSETTEKIEIGPISIDDTKKEVKVDGEKKSLSRKEYELLLLLASNAGKTLSGEEIIEKLWSSDSIVSASDVRQFIYLLRQKIEKDTSDPRFIFTERGFGYRFARPEKFDG